MLGNNIFKIIISIHVVILLVGILFFVSGFLVRETYCTPRIIGRLFPPDNFDLGQVTLTISKRNFKDSVLEINEDGFFEFEAKKEMRIIDFPGTRTESTRLSVQTEMGSAQTWDIVISGAEFVVSQPPTVALVRIKIRNNLAKKPASIDVNMYPWSQRKYLEQTNKWEETVIGFLRDSATR